ncbi:hypothetical protein BH11VER1_BH11VER1_13720 [soil metagenome]
METSSPTRPKPSASLRWYPFRSPEAKAIYENLTGDEALRLAQISWEIIPISIVTPFVTGALVRYGNQHFPGGWGFFTGMVVAGLLVFLATVPSRIKWKRMLCDTAYARRVGYTPANLKLYALRK